jgi:hypothetical protein
VVGPPSKKTPRSTPPSSAASTILEPDGAPINGSNGWETVVTFNLPPQLKWASTLVRHLLNLVANSRHEQQPVCPLESRVAARLWISLRGRAALPREGSCGVPHSFHARLHAERRCDQPLVGSTAGNVCNGWKADICFESALLTSRLIKLGVLPQQA